MFLLLYTKSSSLLFKDEKPLIIKDPLALDYFNLVRIRRELERPGS